MYRQNKLKEELDKLRSKNRMLEMENVYLRERANTLQAELYNIRLEMQRDKLHDVLVARILTEQPVIHVEKDEVK